MLPTYRAAMTRSDNMAEASKLGRSAWKPEHLRLTARSQFEAPPLSASAMRPIIAGCVLWDPWPVQDASGNIAVVAGQELWLALSAPDVRSRDDRHDVARIRFLGKSALGWHDH